MHAIDQRGNYVAKVSISTCSLLTFNTRVLGFFLLTLKGVIMQKTRSTVHHCNNYLFLKLHEMKKSVEHENDFSCN
jgi:hypothetical protein